MIFDTLILTSLVGVLVMILELLNLRKMIIPIVIISLMAILINHFCNTQQGLFFNNMLSYENIAQKFIPIILIIGILIIVLSHNFYTNENHISDFISIKVFIIAGAIAMVSFQNLIIFFIGLEILSIGFYALTASNKENIYSNEAGMKYFLMGSFASALFLLGMTFIYAYTGTFDLSLMGVKITELQISTNVKTVMLVQVGILLMIISLLFKTSVAPFHLWSPDVYQGSPTIITAMLSTISKVAAFGALFKFVYYSLAGFIELYPWILIVTAILSMLIGSIAAIKQKNIKRMLAFSGIANAGFMIIPILASQNTLALTTLTMYVFAYSIGSLVVFSVVLELNKKHDLFDQINSFNGLAKKNSLVALAVTIALLSMAGIPPLFGFFAKYNVIVLSISINLILLISVIISSIVSIYIYFRIIWAMYLKESNNYKISQINVFISILGALILIFSSIFIHYLF